MAKEDENIPGSRELYIGCVRTMAVSQKKVCDIYDLCCQLHAWFLTQLCLITLFPFLVAQP